MNRIILGWLARQPGMVSQTAIDTAFAGVYDTTEITSALGTLLAQGYIDNDGASYQINGAGRASLLVAPNPGDISAGLDTSINAVFAEGTNPDATFLPDVRGMGFVALDARDISWLLGEYGLGASLESGDVDILIRCAKLAKLASYLASRL
jgi:hypothetical protein